MSLKRRRRKAALARKSKADGKTSETVDLPTAVKDVVYRERENRGYVITPMTKKR